MDYITQLLKEHSRSNSEFIATHIGDNKKEFKKIVDIVFNEKAPLPQRASWLLSIVNDKYPELLKPYLKKFIDNISLFKTDGVKRNILNVLSMHEIPEELQGTLINQCFEFILSPNETVAVKVYALQCIANLTKQYPELKDELKSVIEDQLPKTTAAFRARAKRIILNLNRN